MNAGMAGTSFFLKKLLLACCAGVFLASLIQAYIGLQALAIVALIGISLLFLGGILFFLNKHIFTEGKVVTFQIGVGVSVLFLLNAVFFWIWHLFHGGSLTSAFLHSGLLLAQATGMAAFFIGTSACGLFLLKYIHRPLSEGVFGWMFSLGIGLAIFALGTFVLAVLQWVHMVPFVCMVVAFSFLARKEIVEVWRETFRKTLTLTFHKQDIPLWIIWLCIAGVLEMAFISGRATVLVAGFDGFHQYLTFPTEYLRYGGFTPFLWHPSWGFPQLGEMVFLFSLVFFGAAGPFLINFFLLGIFVFGLFQALLYKQESRAHHWLILCIVSSPILLTLGSGVVKIDLLFYFYCLLILVLLRSVFLSNTLATLSDWRVRVLLGVLLGILLSLKYTAFFIVAALFLALLLVSREKKACIKNVVMIFGIAFIILSPWLVKNWVVYKSPLYPVFQGQDQLFQETGKMCSQYFQQLATQDVILSHAGFLYQTGNRVLDNVKILLFSLLYPETQKSLFSPGIWVVLFLPMVLWALFRWKTIDQESRFLLLFSAIFLIFWTLFLLGAIWYLYPAFIALLLFVGKQIADKQYVLSQWWVSIVAFLSVLLAGSGLATFFEMGTLMQFAEEEITIESAMSRVPNEVGPLGMYQRINTLLDEENESVRVYSFMNPRGYFIENSSKQFIFDYYGEKLQCFGETDEDIRNSLKQLKVKYIMVTNERQFRCDKMANPEVNGICRSLSRFELFMKRENLQPLYSEENAVLYKFY